MEKDKIIAPSLICCDLCNLERDVKRLERMGCEMLHVDVLDGKFSPSMPIGLDTIRQLRARSNLMFDAHVMAIDNEFYVEELLDIGVHRVCFQLESQRTPGPLLQKIKLKGVKAGIALAPTTPVSEVEYLVEDCDFVLLMQINPGYASLPGTSKASYMMRKIKELRKLMNTYHPEATITVDGRVGINDMKDLHSAGVSTFVSGTQGVFKKEHLWQENWQEMLHILEECKGY